MLYYITGGQRSGKSRYAQNLALTLSPHPIYLATSRVWDDEHRRRIEQHQTDRGAEWKTIEEETCLSKHNFNGEVVLLDCITLWLTNLFSDAGYNAEKALDIAKQDFDELLKQNFTLIAISNEIGMGVIPDSTSVRQFVDLQGWVNQYVAKRADKVTLMVSGLPVVVK